MTESVKGVPGLRGHEVLVLGATGSVGGRLAAALHGAGARVRALHRRSEQATELARHGFVPHAGDLSDPDSIARAAEGCSHLFHCAGEADHRADPQALSWLHVAGTENVVNAARSVGVSRMVMLSCADVRLQNRERIHIREDQPMLGAPLGPWARTKLLAEEVALQATAADFGVVALRPAFLWGAGDHTNLPVLCREGLSGGVRLFGSGEGLFSVCAIDNLVHAMGLAAFADAAVGKAIHVTDGEYETAGEFFNALSLALSLPAPRRGVGPVARGMARLRDLQRRAGETGYSDVVRRGRGCLLDIQRAINDLGYVPLRSRTEALADLTEDVVTRGGVAEVARHRRSPPGPELAQAFERLAG